MNGSPQLPQYTFDPATQQYRLKTPAEQAQEQQKGKTGLGALYDSGGADSMGPQGPVGFGMMGPGMAEMGVGLQNMGQFANQMGPMAAFSPVTSAVTGLAGMAGNAMMGSQVSPVANPTPATVTSIAPDPAFSGLAAMNAQMAAENEANQAAAAQAQSVAEAAEAATAMGISPGVGEDTSAQAAADAAAAATDGGGIGSDGMGGFSDAGGEGPGGPGNAAGTAGVGDGEREGGMIRRKNYKEGGIASLAEKVESKGRGDDKMLVHMTPGEVAGLQYLAMQHGGSLTINPDTGLAEAGFLSNILPTIAGAALTIGSGGTINPYMSAAIVGGLTGLTSGSLEKGLFAGLGAFGGANLGAGIHAAGTAGTPVTAASQTTAAITPQAVAGPSVSSVYPQEFMRGSAAQFFDPSVAAGAVPTSAAPAGIVRAYTPSMMENFTQAGRGMSNLFDFSSPAGTEARKAFIGQAADKKTGQEATGLGGTMGALKTVGLAAAPFAGSMFSAEEPDTGGKPQEYIRPYGFDFKPSAETDPNFKFRTGERGESTAEQRYFTPTFTPMGVFKAGTEPGGSFYGTPTEDLYNLYSGPRQGTVESGALGAGLSPFNKETIRSLSSRQFSAGGIAGLRKGRFLEDKTDSTGNSDGMSDSFPAVINGEQPARLTDGEFVVPADVVSHLGNGSSKAGAKRLHNMMDRIRAARTGTKKQAPAVKAEKFMPA